MKNGRTFDQKRSDTIGLHMGIQDTGEFGYLQRLDSMKMDEKKRFGSEIFEMSEPFQRRLNGQGRLKTGEIVENAPKQ